MINPAAVTRLLISHPLEGIATADEPLAPARVVAHCFVGLGDPLTVTVGTAESGPSLDASKSGERAGQIRIETSGRGEGVERTGRRGVYNAES
jgi:hypothetical protein